MAILVSGGAGYIGSHTCIELLAEGHTVVIVDNLINAKPEAVARIRAIEADYLAHADVVQAEAWQRRPGWQRSREGIARLADSLM